MGVMLDLHATSSGGSAAALTNIGTILLGGDLATVAGVPVAPKANLCRWGAMTTIADTISRVRMTSLDQIDPVNGEDYSPGAGSLIGYVDQPTNLPYVSGARTIAMLQNTGAANNMGFTTDLYTNALGRSEFGSYTPKNKIIPGASTFGGALTAITWGNLAVAPANPLPNGTYAILGAWANALTNYGLVRFRHPDFGNFTPGFPVIDQTNTAVANACLPKSETMIYQGWQFVRMGEITGQPCCPVFRVTNAGTGLTIQAAAITADTPIFHLNLMQVSNQT